MRTYTITEYDAEDIDRLHDMSNAEVVNVLEEIKRGWLPQSYITVGSTGKMYTETQYDNARLHIAMDRAIEILSKEG